MAIGAGAQIAVATAGIVLLRSNLHDVVVSLDLAQAIFRRIWLNFMWAFGYNVVGIPLAAGVLFPVIKRAVAPEVAGLAMALSSVSVVVSSLLLKQYRRPVVEATGEGSGPDQAGSATRAGRLPRVFFPRVRRDHATTASAAGSAVAGRRAAVVAEERRGLTAVSDPGDVDEESLALTTPRELLVPVSLANFVQADGASANAKPPAESGAASASTSTGSANAVHPSAPTSSASPTAATSASDDASASASTGIEIVDLSRLKPPCTCSSTVCTSNRLDSPGDWEKAWTVAARRERSRNTPRPPASPSGSAPGAGSPGASDGLDGREGVSVGISAESSASTLSLASASAVGEHDYAHGSGAGTGCGDHDGADCGCDAPDCCCAKRRRALRRVSALAGVGGGSYSQGAATSCHSGPQGVGGVPSTAVAVA